MATDSNRDSKAQDDEINLEEIRRLVLKTANVACSSCLTTISSPLENRLQQACKSIKPSTPKGNHNTNSGMDGFRTAPRSCPGLSPTPSPSSDSSGGHLSISSKDKGKGHLPTARSTNSVPGGASATIPSFKGSSSNSNAGRDNHLRVTGQEGGGQPIPNSRASAGRGRNQLAANGVIAKRRKRPSKKPPTKIIEVSKEDFRHTVQRITGCPLHTAQLVRPLPERPQPEREQPERPQPERPQLERQQQERPQPDRQQVERPQANAVPVSIDRVANPPARRDSSSTSRTQAVPSASPTVSNRVPEATYSVDSSGSASSSDMSSDLNYTMGYGGCNDFPFGLPDDTQLADDDLQSSDDLYSRKAVQYTSRASALTPTAEARFKGASTLENDDKKEDIPREHRFAGYATPECFPTFHSECPRNRRNDEADDLDTWGVFWDDLAQWSPSIHGFQ